jgi:hypothetical protein
MRTYLVCLKFCSIAVLLLTSTCSTIPKTTYQRSPAQVVRQRVEIRPQVIFLIHGFRDNGDCFADLPNILSDLYFRDNVRVKMLTYPSLINNERVQKLTSYDFAKMMNSQIINFLIEEGERDRNDPKHEYAYPVDLQTPYSIIAHSQGGMITMNYLNSCLRGVDRNNPNINLCPYQDGIKFYKELGLDSTELGKEMLAHLDKKNAAEAAPNVRNFISLSTPFWGSPVANAVVSLEKIVQTFRTSLPQTQIQNLAIGSRSPSLIRTWLLNRYAKGTEEAWTNMTAWVNRYPKNLRVFNLSASIGRLFASDPNLTVEKRLLDWALNPAIFEHDLAVPAAEARADFLYFVENLEPNRSPFKGRTHLVSAYYPLEYAHLNIWDYPGLAGINEANKDTHPTMALIKQILAWDGNPDDLPRLDKSSIETHVTEKLANFTSEIKVITPIGYNRRFIIKPVTIAPDEPNAFVSVRLKGAEGIWSQGQNFDAIRLRNNFYQTYYHIGRFKDAEAFYPRTQNMEDHFSRRPDGYKINYKIEVVGFKSKEFSVGVMPSFSSYSEIYIQPDFPLKASDPNSSMPIGNFLGRDGKHRGFLLQNGKLSLQIFSNSSANDLTCFVGFVASEEIDESDRIDYIDIRRPSVTHNQLAMYKDFADPHDEVDFKAQTGQPIEILGRVALGYKDPITGIARGCTREEQKRAPQACAKPAIDRYLVTSPSIRERDGIKLFSDITATSGVRWIDVINVDSPLQWTEAASGFGFVVPFRKARARSDCIKDDESRAYLGSRIYKTELYPDIGSGGT